MIYPSRGVTREAQVTLMNNKLQLPEPTPGRYAVTMGNCRYEHEEYGWRSLYGALYHSWQDILDSRCDFVVEEIKP